MDDAVRGYYIKPEYKNVGLVNRYREDPDFAQVLDRFDSSLEPCKYDDNALKAQFENYLGRIYGQMKVNCTVHSFLDQEKIRADESNNEADRNFLFFLQILFANKGTKTTMQ